MERADNLERFEWHAAASSAHVGAGAPVFACAALLVVGTAALLAGWMPLRFSIVTVFLFAGPHNWFELRYFIARLPARLGRSRNFFCVAFAGIAFLLAAYAALPLLGHALVWTGDEWTLALGVWNSLLILWLASLVWMRGRQTPRRRDWSWSFAAACALIAANWLAPQMFSLALVYLHPLVALWFLERQLRRTRPGWLRAYHLCLAFVPLCVGLLWWQLADAPALASSVVESAGGGDALALRITRHAGANLLTGVSSHLLVSTHVFLETIHYGVWLLALPLAASTMGGARRRDVPWRISSLPLVRRTERSWPRLIRTALVLAAVCVVLLWLAFLADYSTTRDLYFTLAMAHVLAEAPFLLRML
ncbi:MAG TPA: hypothetical protein VF656_19370 [Pyrinomonadaceae bacterium]